MDAHAHLLSLGWAGPGHALDSRLSNGYKQTGKHGLDYNPKQATSTGVGLVKPLMISQRKERFGIGKKNPKHEPAAGNEWWLKGFETALGNIGKPESERSGTATPVPGQGNGNAMKHAGLYGFFIKGQQMEGTIGEELLTRGRKRKSDQISSSTSDDDNDDELEETKKPKDVTDVFAQAAVFINVRDKDEKQRRRTNKAGALEEFQQATQFFEATSDRRKKKNKIIQTESGTFDEPEVVDVGGPIREETKEERRERRRKRKEERATKKGSLVGRDGDLLSDRGTDTSKRKPKEERKKAEGRSGWAADMSSM